jgi:hypothetical protein
MIAISFLLILALVIHALHMRSQIAELNQRVALLESPRRAVPPPLPRVEPVRRPEPVFAPMPEPVTRPVPQAAPEPAGPSLTDRLRASFGGEEWEAILGGSILNKVGALVLVIGIALFLGFSFGRISPAGRAAMAGTVSLAILGGGVWAERQARYRLFARGLIGAGWAALYATTYAIYAVPAARVIDDPVTGSVILLGVGAAMIAHSLRYRSQAVTAVAYFSAFAALAVTPSSPFAVLGLIPLAGSILYLAAKFEWYPMALFGLLATYATCISRGRSDAPLPQIQALFLAYWLLFQLFDLLRVKRHAVRGGVEWIYYGNLAGFGVLSYLAWSHHAPSRLWFAAACGSALYLADAIVRAVLRPPSSFAETDGIGERLEAGSFEVSALVSAVLAGASLVANVSGVWLSFGLALEAEAIYLIGARFLSPFLQYLGIAAFVHSLLRLGLTPAGKSWTPPVLFHAVLFYVNRVVRRPNLLMSTAAALLVALALGLELPVAHLGAGWIVFALLLFEVGLRFTAIEFRVQAYALAFAGVTVSMIWGDVAGLAIGTGLILACAVRARWIEIEERAEFALLSSGLALALAFALTWRALPIDYLALSWFGLSLIALELGNANLPEQMRGFVAPAGAVALLCAIATQTPDAVKFAAGLIACVIALRAGTGWLRQEFVAAGAGLFLWGADLVVADRYVTIVWTGIALAVLELGFREIAACAFAAIYYRLFAFDLWHTPGIAMPPAIAALYWLWYRVRTRALFWLVPVPLMALLFQTAGGTHASPAYMICALILLGAGVRFKHRDACVQSYIVASIALAFAVLHRELWISIATAALLYAAQALADRKPAAFLSVGATTLIAALLYTRISGEMLTVAWGLEGLALLACGFALRERVLRLQGLALLLVCILKLFLYDLRNLDTFPRILSFIALGAIMLGVSWIYTRFRNHLRNLL